MVVGLDTRLSSYALITACQAGIAAAGGRAQDIGGSDHAPAALHGGLHTKGGYGEASLTGYYNKLSTPPGGGTVSSWTTTCL